MGRGEVKAEATPNLRLNDAAIRTRAPLAKAGGRLAFVTQLAAGASFYFFVEAARGDAAVARVTDEAAAAGRRPCEQCANKRRNDEKSRDSLRKLEPLVRVDADR